MIRKFAARSVLAAFAALVAASVLAGPAEDVKALLDASRPNDAYATAKRTPEALGDPAFDFYFGVAAIEAGHAGEGVLALERYLLSFPDNASARQLLARGYYLLGEDARAREEFTALRKLGPPPEVLAAIDRFLESIRLREAVYAVSSGAYIEFGVGRDSNVNAGPAGASIFVPGFGFQPLSVSSQETPATFSMVGAGAYVNRPLEKGIALFAQGQGERRFHVGAATRQFELGNYNAVGGVSVLRGNEQYRFGVNYGIVTVGSSNFRRSLGLSSEWQHQLDKNQFVILGAQAARLRYSTTESQIDGTVIAVDNSPRDADSYGITAAYKRMFLHGWEPVLILGLNAGNQHSRTGHPELVPRSAGVSAALNFSPIQKWGLLFGYTHQRSDYRGPDFFAQPDSRRDRYSALSAGVTYLYSRNVSIRGEALFSKNRSNADAYAFERRVYAVKLRYEFK